MSLFRELTIKWNGDDFYVVPDMRMMKRIESNGISLTDVASRTSRGQAPLSHISYILSMLLTEAGATACSDEEVYAAILYGSNDAATAMVSAVLEAFSPENQTPPGKPASRDAQGGTSNRKSKRKQAATAS